MDLRLYGECIPTEKNPKFLGVVFDARLNFQANIQSIRKKVGDRINLLKILSYDKTWRLNQVTLVKMYKCLVRSVLDYASITSGALNKKSRDDLETLQNNSLRVILKKRLLDKVSAVELRKMADVETIEKRHEHLMEEYFERALITRNPLLDKMFVKYKNFKSREWINENLAGNCTETLELIKKHNKLSFNKTEKYPTSLCASTKIVKEFILDNFEYSAIT